MLTKNNEKTIREAIESSQASRVLIGDFGSTDRTVEIAESLGAEVYNVTGRRDQARSYLASLSDGLCFWLEPWEVVLQGTPSINGRLGSVRLMHNGVISWETRIWRDKPQFVNPVFERIDSKDPVQSRLVITSYGGLDSDFLLSSLEHWKAEQPLSNLPYYYESCVYLSQARYDDFLRAAEHYLYLDNKNSMAVTMTRYYYAMVQLTQKHTVKPTLKNLNLCLSVKPLMAEFWCLTGDVYYHLLNRFDMAKEFYENAIILGEKRLFSDQWPMDISKYHKYPSRMIESCRKIISTRSDFSPLNGHF